MQTHAADKKPMEKKSRVKNSDGGGWDRLVNVLLQDDSATETGGLGRLPQNNHMLHLM